MAKYHSNSFFEGEQQQVKRTVMLMSKQWEGVGQQCQILYIFFFVYCYRYKRTYLAYNSLKWVND